MLTARRFTKVPTSDCRRRLDEALSNQRPIARGDPHRPAVAAVQSALADLNRNYLGSADVDGYFGPITYGAVEGFQRDYGLAADGIVGRQTLTQLDTLFGADVVGEPIGRSVHIGVDKVDPAHYGSDFALASCVNDARKMREIAEGIGYDAVTLENEQATALNFTAFMRRAVTDLFDGDSLLVTFSGHGSQVPDITGDEEDLLDETLCFYDRMLIDDEFYSLLGQFRPGVRVHAMFDSCHSGTVAKALLVPGEHDEHLAKGLTTIKATMTDAKTTVTRSDGIEFDIRPIAAKSLMKALDGAAPTFAKAPKPLTNPTEDLAHLFADVGHNKSTDKMKSILLFAPIYENNKTLYDAVISVVKAANTPDPVCTVVTLSACRDYQTTLAGQVYSLFTYNFFSTWNSGAFEGSYDQFHKQLLQKSGADVTPELNTYGSYRVAMRREERPLYF